jgi:hypothetical protein
MTNIFLENGWAGPLLFIILFIPAYALVLVFARLYKAQNIIKVEGTFMLTTAIQKDVDARRISPRLIFLLVAISVLLFLIWLLTIKSNFSPEWYLFVIGAMMLPFLVVIIRNLHGWFLYRNCTEQGGIKGHIEYPRKLILQISSLELFTYAGLFLVIFLFTSDLFLLGGTTTCSGIAIVHYIAAKKQGAKIVAS